MEKVVKKIHVQNTFVSHLMLASNSTPRYEHFLAICDFTTALKQKHLAVNTMFYIFFALYMYSSCSFFTGKKYYRVKFGASVDSDNPNIVERNITIRGETSFHKVVNFVNIIFSCMCRSE